MGIVFCRGAAWKVGGRFLQWKSVVTRCRFYKDCKHTKVVVDGWRRCEDRKSKSRGGTTPSDQLTYPSTITSSQ
jgi:hypothetical protein